MKDFFDLIIIGAGPGGYEAALEATRQGLYTALIEKDTVGGTCLNRGCIPTKTLLQTGNICREVCKAGRYGVRIKPYAVDMKMVQQYKQEVISTLRKGMIDLLKTGKIALYTGCGKVLSPQKVQVTDADNTTQILEGKRILLATGSTPSTLAIPGSRMPGIMTSDELLAYEGKPFDSLLVIGGGVIGVEFATIYQAFGTKITILEALPSLLSNMDKELGQSLKLSFKKSGVEVHTGAVVQRFVQTESGISCAYTEKGQEYICSADAVLIAVGRHPFTEGLFSKECIPATDRGRVLVNDSYETSISGIYAIGDVSGKIQLAHAAAAQGRKAIWSMMRMRTEMSPALIPYCVYTNPEIASVGLTLEQAKKQGLPARNRKILSSANGKSVLSLQERGFIKVVYLEDSHVIIGAQLLCARATDMIGEFTIAIQNRMRMEDLAAVIRPHPSFSEMITDAVML